MIRKEEERKGEIEEFAGKLGSQDLRLRRRSCGRGAVRSVIPVRPKETDTASNRNGECQVI